jgi:hypothetical protein
MRLHGVTGKYVPDYMMSQYTSSSLHCIRRKYAPDYTMSHYMSSSLHCVRRKYVHKKDILHTVSNTSIYCSSDKVGTCKISASLANFATLKMEAIRSSEMSVNTRPTQRHIPEDDILLQSWYSLPCIIYFRKFHSQQQCTLQLV